MWDTETQQRELQTGKSDGEKRHCGKGVGTQDRESLCTHERVYRCARFPARAHEVDDSASGHSIARPRTLTHRSVNPIVGSLGSRLLKFGICGSWVLTLSLRTRWAQGGILGRCVQPRRPTSRPFLSLGPATPPRVWPPSCTPKHCVHWAGM